MTLAAYLEVNGTVCVVCRTDVSAAGVSPGDGRLYCPSCHAGDARPFPSQLVLELGALKEVD